MVLHHPGAVAVVPLHDDGTVTLVRQYRAALEHDLLELPGGHARRRTASESRPPPSASWSRRPGWRLQHRAARHAAQLARASRDETVTVFLAKGLTEVADDRQGVEELAMASSGSPLEDGLAMIDDGRITDAKTIIGLTLVARRMG